METDLFLFGDQLSRETDLRRAAHEQAEDSIVRNTIYFGPFCPDRVQTQIICKAPDEFKGSLNKEMIKKQHANTQSKHSLSSNFMTSF